MTNPFYTICRTLERVYCRAFLHDMPNSRFFVSIPGGGGASVSVRSVDVRALRVSNS
jgi:hypothetical protein